MLLEFLERSLVCWWGLQCNEIFEGKKVMLASIRCFSKVIQELCLKNLLLSDGLFAWSGRLSNSLGS